MKPKLVFMHDGCYTYPIARPHKGDDCVHVRAFCGTRPRAWAMLLDLCSAGHKVTGSFEDTPSPEVWAKDKQLTREGKAALSRLVGDYEQDLVAKMGGSFDY